MRHRDIIQGTRAIKRVPLPLVNVRSSALPDLPELAEQRARDEAAASPGSAPPVVPAPEVGLRVLTGAELKTVAFKAREFSGQTPDKANEEDPLYVLGKSVYTLALACVEPNPSDPRNPLPFFGEPGDVESAAREILDSVHLGRDGITYLCEAQELWEDMCNPQAFKVSGQRMGELIGEIAADPDVRRFLSLGPATRWILLRTMAALLASLQSGSSSSSDTSGVAATTN